MPLPEQPKILHRVFEGKSFYASFFLAFEFQQPVKHGVIRGGQSRGKLFGICGTLRGVGNMWSWRSSFTAGVPGALPGPSGAYLLRDRARRRCEIKKVTALNQS